GNTDTPGIELVPVRLDDIVATGTENATLAWTVSPQFVSREFTDPAPVRPLFAPGDAVFFDHFNLHRTTCSSDMMQTRYAIECWFFAPSKFYTLSQYSKKQIPILF